MCDCVPRSNLLGFYRNHIETYKEDMMDSTWLETMLKKYERDRNISQIISFQEGRGSSSGDSLTVEPTKLKVKIVLSSGKIVTKSFIVKVIPESGIVRKFFLEYGLNFVEKRVYEIYSAMEDLMHEFDDRREKLSCDLIATTPNTDTLILEDLTELNYAVGNRLNCLDINRMTMTLKALARQHIMSKVLIQRGELHQHDLPNYPLVYDDKFVNGYLVGPVRLLAKTIQKRWGKEWLQIGEQLEKYSYGSKQKINDLGLVIEDKFQALLHGDLWVCNLMFKNGDYDNNITSVKFIDFQISNINSVGLELTFLFYSSLNPEIRRNNLQNLLDIYYSAITEEIKRFKYTGPIFNRTELEEEMQRLKHFAIGHLFSSYAITTATTNDQFYMESFDEKNDIFAGFNPKVFESETYKNDVQYDLEDFYKNGLLN